MSFGFLITCMGCGCDDDSACVTVAGEACSWLRIDPDAGVGVCSHCPDEVARFETGDRRMYTEESASEVDEIFGHVDDEPGLILPGDDEFDETLEDLR